MRHPAAAAHEVAASKQHKSISASDVLRALEIVEMGDMVPAIQQELDGASVTLGFGRLLTSF